MKNIDFTDFFNVFLSGATIACLFFLAEWVGFEPTVPLPVHLISSQGRYNHFDTTP